MHIFAEDILRLRDSELVESGDSCTRGSGVTFMLFIFLTVSNVLSLKFGGLLSQ